MHEPGKYKVHDVGLQGWLKYQNMQPLYWERDEHGVMLIVYEKTPVLMELVRMYWESRSYDSCNDRRNTWSRPLQPA